MSNTGLVRFYDFLVSLLAVAMMVMTHAAWAQLHPPFGTNRNIYDRIPTRSLQRDSLIKMKNNLSEDAAGYVVKLPYTTNDCGAWRKFSSAYDTWLFKIKVKNVAGLSLILSDLNLDKGSKLYIYNQTESSDMEPLDLPSSRVLPVKYFRGDELVIELDVPTRQSALYFKIRALSFTDNPYLLNQQCESGVDKRSSSCYPCLTGQFWDDIKRSVVKIITFKDSEAIMCTGVLINNTARDARPYILTGQHCITSQADADQSLFMFGEDDLLCTGHVVSQRSTLSGGQMIASSYGNDFSLIELYDNVPMGSHPYFAGWDISNHNIDHVSCIHHPLGGVKKISLRHNGLEIGPFVEPSKPTRENNAFWHVSQWDSGLTEHGSSGAPLFNSQQNIIGTLTGGKSTCDYPYHDYFERLSTAWHYHDDIHQQLQYWLDPAKAGTLTLDGFDPFIDKNTFCDTLSNITTGDITTAVSYPGLEGYLSGCNSSNVNTYAEAFNAKDAMVTGLQIYINDVNTVDPGGVSFSIMEDSNGSPGKTITSTYIPYNELHLYFNYVSFYPYVSVKGKFFITYTLDCSDNNSFRIDVAKRLQGVNSAYVNTAEGWKPVSDILKDGAVASFYIQPIVCTTIADVDHSNTDIILYPNPVSGQLIVKLPGIEQDEVKVEVRTIEGRIMPADYNSYRDNILINTLSLPCASYVLIITTKENCHVKRFVKIDQE